MKPFKIISREVLLDSPYMPVEKHIVELPNGKQAEWFVNTSEDAVIVIAISKTGEIILERCYKHGCQKIIIEFCACMIDEGETPIEAAERELREETGYRSGKMEKVGEVFSNPTGSQMKYHFFIATDCEKEGPQKLDGAEQIEVFFVPTLEDVEKIFFDSSSNPSCIALAGLSYLRKFKNE